MSSNEKIQYKIIEAESETTKTLKALQYKTDYDNSSKRLLSIKIILAHILKECVPEYKNCSIDEIVVCIEGTPQISELPVLPDEQVSPRITGLSQEDTSLSEGTVTYDIRFNALDPASDIKIHLIINVEAQKDYYPGYPLVTRALYYACRMISSQYGTEFTHSNYQNIKKVYSIWICTNASQERKNTITSYKITEENVIGNVKENSHKYDLLSVVMVCLGELEDSTDDELLKLLNLLYTSNKSPEEKIYILENEFDIPSTEEIKREVSLMCNLSDYIEERAEKRGEERGEKRGEERGEKRGEKRGREIGEKNATVSHLEIIMESLGFGIDEALKFLKIPESKKEMYIELLNNH